MIGVIDYAGNAGSVLRAFERLGAPARRVSTSRQMGGVAGLVLPGAGAAPAAMEWLECRGLRRAIIDWPGPLLGLCLGMQLLFERSQEGSTRCLGRLAGEVRSLPRHCRRPHIGWQRLDAGPWVYFAHSYVCQPADPAIITSTCRYGMRFASGVRRGLVLGAQWHPEKSGRAGDQFLRGFVELCKSYRP